MNYNVVFTNSSIEDLSFLTIYEVRFTFSHEDAQNRIYKLMESIADSLSLFPMRNPAKPYGFTDTSIRKQVIGKYAAFYWVNEETMTVHVERVLHSKSDFSRIHFGN